MKKILLLLFTLCTFVFFAAGCNGSASGNLGNKSDELAGTWSGVGNALGRDNTYSCDNLNLSIQQDGTFSLKNIAKNSTDISGTLSADTESSLAIHTDGQEIKDLPGGWEQLRNKSKLSYTMPTSRHLVLTYKDVSYFFKKKEKISNAKPGDTSSSPLLNLAENDVWYSKDKDSDSTSTYQLTLYDKYMELYSVDSQAATQGETTFLANFFYLSNRENDFSFFTLKNSEVNFPTFLNDLPDGFSTITIRIRPEDDSILLTCNGKRLRFYNNVLYGQ